MTTTRFPTLLVLPAILSLAASLGDKNCSITRPGGVKEPGVTNIKGDVAAPSTPIAATGMTVCPQRRIDRMAQNSILQCRKLRREIAKVLNSSEDARLKDMSTFRS